MTRGARCSRCCDVPFNCQTTVSDASISMTESSPNPESNGVRGKRGQCYHYCRDNVPTERCVF